MADRWLENGAERREQAEHEDFAASVLVRRVDAGEFAPAFELLEPENQTSPVVFSSPHSGAVYPPSFLASSRLDPLTLRRSEDAFVDELFGGALAAGSPMLRAHFPRAYLDVNREPYELDPRMFEGRLPHGANTRSIRVAGGLGTIARIVGDAQEIYRDRLPVAEALRRIDGIYRPFHAALRQLVDNSWRRFGMAVLVDCHSMPSSAQIGGARPDDHGRVDFILGDRYGTSCDPVFTAWLEDNLRRRGFNVRRNKPYAGGFITESYGAPAMGVHAVQIEASRSLYMNEANLEPHAGFDRLKGMLAELVGEFAVFVAAQNQLPRSSAAE